NTTSSASTTNPIVPGDQLTTTAAAANSSTVVTSSNVSNDRKRHRYDPRWLDGSLREELFGRIDRELKPDDLSLVKDSNPKTTTSIRKDQTSQQQHSTSTINPNPIQFGEQLQFWTDSNSENNTYPRFTHIACLHSELIAINTHGQLCQWNWQDMKLCYD
ncbi:unnamed protein product, partial [Adineta steineri]